MTRNHIDIDARYISGLVHLGSRYSMHLEAGFVLTQCHLRPKWTKPIVKSVPSWADGRWKRLCRGTTECVAVCSVAQPYVSSGLDATCAEGARCSELLRFTKTALYSWVLLRSRFWSQLCGRPSAGISQPDPSWKYYSVWPAELLSWQLKNYQIICRQVLLI